MMRRGHGLLVLAGLVAAGCIVRPDELVLGPDAEAAVPEIRIGVLPSAASASLSSDRGMIIVDPDEGDLAMVAGGTEVPVLPRGTGLLLEGGGGGLARRAFTIEPARDGVLLLEGRAYPGVFEVTRTGAGLRLVNRVGLEQYLVGVVGAEMGRRTPEEREALKAQAVASRTYALRNLGRFADQGFDLAADVSSQVYGDARTADTLVMEAVAATHGEVLEYDGVLIDAFFSSTCGGHSEDGVAAFAGADRPYLRAQPDLAPDGTAWCAISPRFTWREQWTGAQLLAILRRTLASEGLPAARATDLRDVRPLDRTGSGRIASLELVGSRGRTVVRGQAIRRVLSPAPGAWLRSTDFTIRVGRGGSRIERVTVEGRGYGHGVGMCQWGAIGRSRAGHEYTEILMSYFPGTSLRRIY